MPKNRKYTFCNFMVDVLMTCLTGGFWLIWVFCRESRNR